MRPQFRHSDDAPSVCRVFRTGLKQCASLKMWNFRTGSMLWLHSISAAVWCYCFLVNFVSRYLIDLTLSPLSGICESPSRRKVPRAFIGTVSLLIHHALRLSHRTHCRDHHSQHHHNPSSLVFAFYIKLQTNWDRVKRCSITWSAQVNRGLQRNTKANILQCEFTYLPDLSIFNTISCFQVLVTLK